MTRWALLTGEYPPQPGGVSDYTRLVARGLAAAGDAVTVYAPLAEGEVTADPGVAVVRLPDHFGPRGLAVLDRALAAHPQRDRILVQYTPHAFGWKAMNLPFAGWLACRSRRLAPLWVMFHEVAFPFSRRPRHAVLGAVTRVMARAVAGAADRVFVSIPAWGELVRRLCPRARRPEWLPVPCNLPTAADPADVAAVRARFAPDPAARLIGHFGTFGDAITELLVAATARSLRADPSIRVLLVGRGSGEYRERFVALHPDLGARVVAAGGLAPEAVAAHLRACELLVQPYPDGVSSRRTSVMAGLADGVPVVTNLGVLSEPLWAGSGAVAAAPAPDPAAVADLAVRLLANPGTLADLGRRGLALYRDTFAPEHTIAALRSAPE